MERFLLTCMMLFVLALIYLKIHRNLEHIEHFDNISGGVLDIRSGILGNLNTKSANSWIQVATFSLSNVSQQIDIVLEVYGPTRQTFLLNVTNNDVTSHVDRFMHVNQFGPESVVFNSAYLMSSGTGLAMTYTMYLQINSDACQNIPVIWYLKGAGTNDVFAVQNVAEVNPPASGGIPSQLFDSVQSVANKINSLSTALSTLQNQVDNISMSTMNRT